MKHDIKVLEVTNRRDGRFHKISVVDRDIKVLVDGVEIKGLLSLRIRNNCTYHLILENKLLRAHPDYKSIRLNILTQASRLDNKMSYHAITRQYIRD